MTYSFMYRLLFIEPNSMDVPKSGEAVQGRPQGRVWSEPSSKGFHINN